MFNSMTVTVSLFVGTWLLLMAPVWTLIVKAVESDDLSYESKDVPSVGPYWFFLALPNLPSGANFPQSPQTSTFQEPLNVQLSKSAEAFANDRDLVQDYERPAARSISSWVINLNQVRKRPIGQQVDDDIPQDNEEDKGGLTKMDDSEPVMDMEPRWTNVNLKFRMSDRLSKRSISDTWFEEQNMQLRKQRRTPAAAAQESAMDLLGLPTLDFGSWSRMYGFGKRSLKTNKTVRPLSGVLKATGMLNYKQDTDQKHGIDNEQNPDNLWKGHVSKREPDPGPEISETGLTLSITSPLDVLREKIRMDNSFRKQNQKSRNARFNSRFLKDLGRR